MHEKTIRFSRYIPFDERDKQVKRQLEEWFNSLNMDRSTALYKLKLQKVDLESMDCLFQYEID